MSDTNTRPADQESADAEAFAAALEACPWLKVADLPAFREGFTAGWRAGRSELLEKARPTPANPPRGTT